MFILNWIFNEYSYMNNFVQELYRQLKNEPHPKTIHTKSMGSKRSVGKTHHTITCSLTVKGFILENVVSTFENR